MRPETLSPGKASTNRERRPPQEIPTFSPSPREVSQRVRSKRSMDAFPLGERIAIASLTEAEIEAIRLERQAASNRADERIRRNLEKAYDMTREERSADPKRGALYNYAFLMELPEQLRQVFIDNPDLEVSAQRWRNLYALRGGSYITFAGGEMCYIDDIGRRTYLSPQTITNHFNLANRNGDPEAFRPFAMLGWKEIRHDVQMAAATKGYNILALR